MQYTLIFVMQAVLLCVIFTFGVKVVDMSLARARTANACVVNPPPVAQQQDGQQEGLRQYLSC